MKVSRKIIIRCFCNEEHLNFIVSLTYDYRKLLSHRKVIVRFSCNQAPGAPIDDLTFAFCAPFIWPVPNYTVW